MKRVAILTLCLLAFASACGHTASAPAATVNGNRISTQELVDELNAISANPDYITSLQSGAPSNGCSTSCIMVRRPAASTIRCSVVL